KTRRTLYSSSSTSMSVISRIGSFSSRQRVDGTRLAPIPDCRPGGEEIMDVSRAPLLDQSEGPPGQIGPRKDLARFDDDPAFVLRVADMEVRRVVVVGWHRDDDAVEVTDPWHVAPFPLESDGPHAGGSPPPPAEAP